MNYDYLIVGSGLFGSIIAYEMTKKGKKCLVIEKRDHIGGNVYTEKTENIKTKAGLLFTDRLFNFIANSQIQAVFNFQKFQIERQILQACPLMRCRQPEHFSVQSASATNQLLPL